MNCTFANRLFQTTVFTANKPKFFPLGVADLLCREEGVAGFLRLQQGLPHPDTVSPGDMFRSDIGLGVAQPRAETGV